MTIVQSGEVAQNAASLTLTGTFASTAIAGNIIVVLATSDNSLTCAAVGGAGALTQRIIATGFVNSYVFTKVADGTETGITCTCASTTGQAFEWYELSGNTTFDSVSSALSGGTSINAHPVGTVTPTATDDILWAAGCEPSRTYDSTSVGTFDGGIAGTRATTVALGAGHINSASAQTPTVHVTVAVGNGAGVIVCYKAPAVTAIPDVTMAPMRG